MKFYNYELSNFLDFLYAEELDGKESRMRRRFRKLCLDRLDEINIGIQELLEKYAKRDENSNFVMDSDGGIFLDNPEEYNRDYNELLNEEFIIDELEERRDVLLAIKDIVLNSNQKMSNEKARMYERFCDIVEEINYEGN